MLTDQMLLQNYAEDKMVLEELFKMKELVDQMDLLEFKTQWNQRSKDYTSLDSKERLKYLVMSIKVLQAKVDLKRMMISITERSAHSEPQEAIYHYLRTNLWKFLDNFRYVLLVEDVSDAEKLECIDALDGLTEMIAQDKGLKDSCLIRLPKILEQIRHLKYNNSLRGDKQPIPLIYEQLEQRISKLIRDLEPEAPDKAPPPQDTFSSPIRDIIKKYSLFSVARISIEKSGVLSIIRLLQNHPLVELEEHRKQLQETLMTLEQQVLYNSTVNTARNECAYALVALLEILKMHKGLPVLILKILELCSYIQFPPPNTSLDKELRELKGRVTEISQKKLLPIIRDVLWKNPLYIATIPCIRAAYPWCYQENQENVLNISNIRKVVTSSFDRLESAPGVQLTHEGTTKSRLSEMVIEILGLLVNIEPSPRFLKLHSQETEVIKEANRSTHLPSSSKDKLLDKQYTTYKNHLKFLQDSIDYYDGISERIELWAKSKSNNSKEKAGSPKGSF